MVADDGVVPGKNARPTVVIVARRQVGRGWAVGDEEHGAHGATVEDARAPCPGQLRLLKDYRDY
jgi:hypothetical protein